jgi:antitoxin VapB
MTDVHGCAVALHINDAETDKLARELAQETGETLTVAVNKALKERLDRVTAAEKKKEEKLLAEFEKILSRVSPELRNEKKTGRELIDEMYDEDGLPR